MRHLSPTKQGRALRSIASALLASNASPLEIHHLAEALRSDSRFQDELAFFLHELAAMIEHRQRISPRSSSAEKYADNDLVSAGLAVVKRRRLSKDQIIGRIRSISPSALDYVADRHLTVRGILSKFADHESEEKMNDLISALAGPGEADEYLKGMAGKSDSE